MRTATFVLFASSLAVASAQTSFVPGSSRGCIAGKKCVEAIKLSASKEIELFIGKNPAFEVYPGRAVSVNRFDVENNGIWLRDNITALQANNDTRPFAASYIRAQKLRFNLFGFRTPEFEFQWNGTSRVEIYYNRFITLNEFQARGNIKVGRQLSIDQTNVTPDFTNSTIYAPFSPLLITANHSTMTLEAKDGIKLHNVEGATAQPTGSFTGCGAPGTLGLFQKVVSVCKPDGTWEKILGYTPIAGTPTNTDFA